MPEAGAERCVGSALFGKHVSLVYDADEEFRDLLTGFAARAVAAGHRVVLFLDADSADLGRALAAALPDAAPGQFTALRYRSRAGLAGADGGTSQTGAATFGEGLFGVQELLAAFTRLRDEAFAAGYSGISLAVQMLWTQRAGFTPTDLLAYETRVNRFFGDPRVTGLCLYDGRHFAKELLARIGAVHPGPLLRFTLGGWGAHLRLTGQLDASNVGSLPSILDLVAEADSVVLLDASELEFVDAAGAGTIVRFAASRPHRHTVVRCARGVRQALQLVGAEAVPSLVLRDGVAGV
ncbi:MEDS domain-containing protein [Dactylosporangium sp. NPDC051485]|uniref:MEDS domain-containing protein n=1 Tax=Dactylosporangium sp. NPDC051485 TaxID=3154846 RepID=UPI003432C5C5